MSEKRLKIILPVIILVAGAVGTVAMIKSRAPVPTRPPEDFAPYVRVVEAQRETRQLTVSTNGTVAPRTETTIVAEVSGRVISTSSSFASGGFFDTGDVILTIDPTDYEVAVVNAESEVARTRVQLETEQAQAKVAREEWEELGEGEGSPLATRELQVREARAALAAAEARLTQARRDLERTRVRAPFPCRVGEKMADVGRYLTPGTPVARLYAIDYVEIRLPVPDNQLAFIDFPIDYRGEIDADSAPRVELRADFAGAPRVWDGRLVRIEGEIDPTTRMINLVAQVDDPYGRRGGDRPPLAVGMFVDATIMGRVAEDVIVLPRAALRGDSRVYVIDADNRLRFRDIEVMRATRDSVVIAHGLEPGERVCMSTFEAVTDGMDVRTEAAADSTGAADDAAATATTTGGRQ